MEGPLSGEALSVPRRGAEGGRPHVGSLATLVFDADMPRAAGCTPGGAFFPVFFLAVSWKRLMLFPLKPQRNGQQHALAVDSAKGKAGEKGRIFTVLWR